MASQPGLTVRTLTLTAAVGVVSGLVYGSLTWAGAPTDPAACVYQYAPRSGDACFAVAVRAERSQLPPVEIRRHVILVDTSASQSGTYRKRAMEIVEGYLGALSAKDQVQLFSVDVKAQPMMETFAAPTAEAARNACEELAARAPLGATDLLSGLKTAMAGIPSGEPASIVYIGDGMSAARLANVSAVASTAAELRDRRIAIHSVAVGPQTDLELLGTLAQLTGGVTLLEKRNGTKPVSGAELAEAARSPIAYPTTMTVDGPHVDLLPGTPLPIRGDRATVYLGRGLAPKQFALRFQFSQPGNPPLTIRVGDATARTANGVLSVLWKRAQSTGGVALPLAGSQLIAAAEDAFDERLVAMVDQGEHAVAVRDAATGEQIARNVRALDPMNARAAGLLAAVDRLRKETAAQQVQLAQASKSGETPPAPPVPASAEPSLEPRKGPPAEDSVTKYRELMRIRGQQLTQEVKAALDDAKRIGLDDPDAAVMNLKRVEAAVTTASDIEPQVREGLQRRLRDTVLELRAIKERRTITAVKRAEQLAQIEARQKSLEQMTIEEQRLTQLIDQARALLVQAVHGDDNAYEEAEAVAREGINLRPGNGPATQAMYNAEGAGQLNKAYRLRNLRADRLLESLYLVELAHVPFPDEPPIEWPNAQVWRALTEKRQKWKSVDLRSESPSEARISQALDKPVEFDIAPQPLGDALDFIAARFGIPIILDKKTLDDAGVETTTEVSLNVPGIKLRNMLKLLLEKLQQPLTYVIEDEVMKITTVEKAKEILSIRMYPVGDLIMGPQQLMAMTGGGGMGGMMGRGMGGMGGGMGGMGGGMGMGGMGMGGMGMGGMGGGMFSLPSETPGADAPATDKPAAPNVFNNGSVESSKKKLSGAR